MKLTSRVARGLVAGGAVFAMLGLSACSPEDVNGQVKCERDATGKITCSYVPNTPPVITEPPVTEPPETTEPPVTEEPADPNAGLAAAELTATSLQGKARVDWTTDRSDITGWHIERDGQDTGGFGVWGTELPADARSFTFDLLRGGDKYTVTLVGHTASGSLPPVTSTVVPTGTPPVVEPPVVEPTNPPVEPPVTGGGTTAAEKLGWGTPLAAGSDEFNYTGKPDSTKWNVAGECWAGHDGNGKRCASRSNVAGGMLTQTGLANGDSGWLAAKHNQRYGKWEARVRSSGTGSGNAYHPLLIVWPQSDRWPQDGEYDFLENGRPGEACAESFIHYPHNPGATQQIFTKEAGCGAPLTEWHNVAFEWTPQYVAGYIDGKQWFKHSGGANATRKNIQDMPSGHLTIQLDNFYGGGMQPAKYDIDWVRTYQ